MWWHERSAASRCLTRTAAAISIAALVAGCFQPLYGERSFNGGPGLRTALAAVSIAEIPGPIGSPQARMAVELRNELGFALTGGGEALSPTHRLVITIVPTSTSLIVDPTTARAEFEVVGLIANYTLTEISSAKPVVTGSAIAQTSYDVPGQQQRYGMIRGQRDAQSRASKVIAEQIRNRLASYFTAGS